MIETRPIRDITPLASLIDRMKPKNAAASESNIGQKSYSMYQASWALTLSKPPGENRTNRPRQTMGLEWRGVEVSGRSGEDIYTADHIVLKRGLLSALANRTAI